MIKKRTTAEIIADVNEGAFEERVKKAEAKKPRAPRKRKVGKMPELAMPYGRGPHYKTPGICGATRDLLLGTVSGYTLAVMENYNLARVQQVADSFRRMIPTRIERPDNIHVRP